LKKKSGSTICSGESEDSGSDSKEVDSIASATQKSTSTQSNATTKGSKKTTSQQMSLKSTGANSQASTCFAQVFPARHSVLQESGSASMTRGAHSFLKLPDVSKLNDLSYCCLKTSRDCFHTTKEEPSEQSSWSWMNWGTMQNGKCLTARISVFPKTGNVSSLSDILEEHVNEKYFLSKKSIEMIITRWQRHKDKDWLKNKNNELDLPREGQRAVMLGNTTASGSAWRDNSPSLDVSCTSGVLENAAPPDGFRIRRLTPTECERLQGFPDNWTEMLSDTRRYKAMGNAVTVNVVEAIGKELIK